MESWGSASSADSSVSLHSWGEGMRALGAMSPSAAPAASVVGHCTGVMSVPVTPAVRMASLRRASTRGWRESEHRGAQLLRAGDWRGAQLEGVPAASAACTLPARGELQQQGSQGVRTAASLPRRHPLSPT